VKVSMGPRALALPAPVWLIGSYDADGHPNAMAASWAGVCCSHPPCVAVAIRPERHSHHGVAQRGAFTVSVPTSEQVAAADLLGTRSGRDGDKFAAAGLTAAASDLVDAPYVDDCPVVMECRVRQAIELGSHTLFVGEVVDVKAEASVVLPSGALDARAVDPFVLSGGYRALGRDLPKLQ
jgi:flavin reductase (DIM6/NTAB) family NADH-FMN oxidoreductase RutF